MVSMKNTHKGFPSKTEKNHVYHGSFFVKIQEKYCIFDTEVV